jgi:hypothetical protein
MFHDKQPPFEGGEARVNFRWLRGRILPLGTVVTLHFVLSGDMLAASLHGEMCLPALLGHSYLVTLLFPI